MRDRRKVVAYIYRKARADDLSLNNLRIVGNGREARYFHLVEDFMRR